MSLETIKLEQFYDKLPFNASWIGFRKSGKSLSASMVIRYLVKRNAFKRIILFIGTQYCNPELCQIVKTHFDGRLIFTKFSEDILLKIIEQQKKLRDLSEKNTCLIVFDDVYTSENRGSYAMNRIFSSGRHWLISCCTLCVSWTDIIPSCRRALDFVILYSNITTNDTQFLTRNFLHKSLIEPARYALKNNSLYTGLVIVTNPKQKLFLMKFKKKKLDAKLKYPDKEDHSKKIPLRKDNKKSLEGSVGSEEKVSDEKILLTV